MNIGCHLSFSKGYEAMGREALRLGADCFQFFSRNPRGGAARPFDAGDALALEKIAEENSFGPLLVHAPYTFNPCSADAGLREFALEAMKEDLSRLGAFKGALYNFHPGSHVGQGVKRGVELSARLLSEVCSGNFSAKILVETMSGKGSEIGSTFGEIAEILEKSGTDAGVCLDTCHAYSAGYDIVRDLDGALGEFDRIIGLGKLKAVHLNDSMAPFNSKKDRHEKLGEGTIGLEAIGRIVNHPALRELPFYLETPNDPAGYAREIALVRKMRGEP